MEKWLKFNTFKATMKDTLIKLNELVDESDPDVALPNVVHGFQTAERIREDYPDEDWFQLVGLIHDVGKVRSPHSFQLAHIPPRHARPQPPSHRPRLAFACR